MSFSFIKSLSFLSPSLVLQAALAVGDGACRVTHAAAADTCHRFLRHDVLGRC
jgi:hypothetical protein